MTAEFLTEMWCLRNIESSSYESFSLYGARSCESLWYKEMFCCTTEVAHSWYTSNLVTEMPVFGY